MIVYYAELVYGRWISPDFVGVFSSTDKAQAACLNDSIADVLVWEARGDGIFAADEETGAEYWVYPIKVDEAVK